MKKILVLSIAAMISNLAMADFKLASNGKKVSCYDQDNASFELNAKRTTVKYTVEGESKGAQKITHNKSNKTSYASFTTSEGTLVLSDKGDIFQFTGESEVSHIDCK
jgi:uncharacterized protein YdeI (BOF family)